MPCMLMLFLFFIAAKADSPKKEDAPKAGKVASKRNYSFMHCYSLYLSSDCSQYLILCCLFVDNLQS